MQSAANTAFIPKDRNSIVCRAHVKVAQPDAVADLRRALVSGFCGHNCTGTAGIW